MRLRRKNLGMLVNGALFALFTGLLIAFYPGSMTIDSIDQLTQARLGVYSDWHPPLMAVIWRHLDKLWPGPAPMLLLNLGLYISALWFLIKKILPKLERENLSIPKIILFFLVLCSPAIVGQLGTIWKDTLLALMLFWSSLLIIKIRIESNMNSYFYYIFLLLFLFIATGLRHNALPAIAFLIFWGLQKKAMPFFSKILISFLGSTILIFSLNQLTNKFLRVQKTYPIQQILLHDITAIGQKFDLEKFFIKNNLIDFYRNPEEFQQLYSTKSVIFIYCCQDKAKPYLPSANKNQIKPLLILWWNVISEHFVYYLQHRKKVLFELLGIQTQTKNCYPYDNGIAPNNIGLLNINNPFNKLLFKILDKFKNTFFFWGALWALLSFIGFSLFCKSLIQDNLKSQLIWGPAACGFIYFIPYFFVTTTCDFRLIYWTSMSTCLSLCLMIFSKNLNNKKIVPTISPQVKTKKIDKKKSYSWINSLTNKLPL